LSTIATVAGASGAGGYSLMSNPVGGNPQVMQTYNPFTFSFAQATGVNIGGTGPLYNPSLIDQMYPPGTEVPREITVPVEPIPEEIAAATKVREAEEEREREEALAKTEETVKEAKETREREEAQLEKLKAKPEEEEKKEEKKEEAEPEAAAEAKKAEAEKTKKAAEDAKAKAEADAKKAAEAKAKAEAGPTRKERQEELASLKQELKEGLEEGRFSTDEADEINKEIRDLEASLFFGDVGQAAFNRVSSPTGLVSTYKEWRNIAQGVTSMFGDSTRASRRKQEMRQALCKAAVGVILSQECATARLCENNIERIVDIKGLTVTVSPTGDAIPVMHIQAWKNPKMIFINETTGVVEKNKFYRLYKITWYVNNAAQAPPVGVTRVGDPLTTPAAPTGAQNGYNIVFYKDGVEKHRYFDNFRQLNVSQSDGRTNADPFISYSQNEYDEVCIVLLYPMKIRLSLIDDREVSRQCTPIVDIQGEPTSIEQGRGIAGPGAHSGATVNRGF